jgi:hypothetical protein
MSNVTNIANALAERGLIDPFAIDGIEPVLTIEEASVLLRWSYDSTRRYFKDLPGVLVKFQPKRYKRPYKQYMIPKSVFQREWDRMAAFNVEQRRVA